MDSLPNSSVFQIIQRVNQATSGLSQIAQEEGLDINDLTKIWVSLPVGDDEDMSYLEAANQCIVDVSSLIDKAGPTLPIYKKTAIKYRVMSKLLALKSQQLL